MEKKIKIYNILQCVFFLLYFAVLTAERIISLCAAFKIPFGEMITLEIYMTIIAVISLAVGWLYLAIFARRLFAVNAEKSGNEFMHPCIAAGILLVSGMVHTEGTIPVIQFVSYGCLLVAMLLHTVRGVKINGNGLLRWFSFAYITAISMAIPVVYKMTNNDALGAVFYPVESIVSIALIALFTYTLVKFYKSEGLLSFCPFAWGAVAVLDAAVIALRWTDEINYFVLIFACLSLVLGIVGKILDYTLNKKQ